MPSISVVVPTYNDRERLTRCLGSIQGVDYPRDKLEVIVVDDGSSDGSGQEAKRYGCRLLRQPHSGRAHARNNGARAARGELVAFLDSDDVAGSFWLRELLPLLQDEAVAAVGCSQYLLNDTGSFVVRADYVEKRFRLRRELREVRHIGASGSLVRRGLFLDMGGFNPAFRAAEDAELAGRLRDRGYRLALVDRPLIGVTHPATVGVYLRNQVRNAAYQTLLGSRRRGRGVAMGYAGWAEYVQSIFPSTYLVGLVLLPSIYGWALWSVLMLLLLGALNGSFLGFAARGEHGLGRLWPVRLGAFLLLRSLAWNLGLAYGLYLVVRGGPGVAVEVPYSEG